MRLFLFGIALSLAAITAVSAEEAGSGHYIPGVSATLIDLQPTEPGFIAAVNAFHYHGDAEGSLQVLDGGLLTNGLDAEVSAVTIGGFYTFDEKIANAFVSVGMVVPFMDLKVDATVRTPFGDFPATDSDSGVGDITLIPAMLAWKTGNMRVGVSLPVTLPTGSYKPGRLANIGKNYLTVDPTVAVSYSNPTNGFNASGFVGLTMNTENTATNYQSGSLLHIEGSVQQLLPLGPGFVGIGAEAFYLQQVTDDEGAGARLGAFRGHSLGIGPVATYLLATEKVSAMIEAKWLPELAVKNRVQGDFFWLKGVIQF